jgi:Cellulase (glycosyl hydrolase family 5)
MVTNSEGYMDNRYRIETATAQFSKTAILFCLFLAAIAQAQSRFNVGISVHLVDSPTMVPGQLSLIAQTGANSIRDDVHWSHVEREKGHLAIPSEVDDLVNQAVKANVQPLLILDYGNSFYDGGDKPLSSEALGAFARYAAFVVQHFKGRVHMYEMWNEWDDTAGHTHRGTAQDYVRFLRVVYPAVKAKDPSAVFIAGAIAGGLDPLSAMLSAGAVGYFDALSTHPYNFSRHTRTADVWAQDMLATEAVIHRYTGGHDLPLYITEMGWPTNTGPVGSSPKEAAVDLAQMFLLARTMPFLKGIWWYDFRDDGWDQTNKEDNFGLVDPNLKPKPAFAALQTVAPIVKDASSVEELSTGSPSLHALRFCFRGNNQVLALWNKNQTGVIRIHVTGSTPLKIRSVEPDDPNVYPIGTGAKEQTIEISNTPMLITGTNLSVRGSN